MLAINGVIDVGIFSDNKPQIVIVGNESSYRLIESWMAETINWSSGSILWEKLFMFPFGEIKNLKLSEFLFEVLIVPTSILFPCNLDIFKF